MTCYLFAAGDYAGTASPRPSPDAFIIAVDGGFNQLALWGLRPHLAVGDFDSLGRIPQGVPVIRHPPEKNDTDLLLAVKEGLARGCVRFLIYGGLGGRLDHTIGNLHILSWLARQGYPAFLLGGNTAAAMIEDGCLTFSPAHRGTLSVLAWGGDARGVDLVGLRYPLSAATLTCDYPLGVSNEFLGKQAEARVERGTLLALWTQPELLPDWQANKKK